MTATRAYLDCCATLNLYSTGRFAEILMANGANGLVICIGETVVSREALYVGRDDDREEVDLASVVAAGALLIERMESDAEAATAVLLAASGLGAGEAEAGALAYHRAGVVATDDALAIREYQKLRPPVGFITTPGLMKRWADHEAGQPREVVRAALLAIRDRARFVPPYNDPLFDWWSKMAA